MAARVDYDEDSQDSLAQEEIFIAQTTRFAESVVGIYSELKQRKKRSQSVEIASKGLAQSRVQFQSIVCDVTASAPSALGSASQQQVDPATAEHVKFAERLWQISEKHQNVLVQQYDRHFQLGGKSTVWDIDYAKFKRTCSSVLRATVDALANRKEQVLLVFANCFYVYEELQQAGVDTERQNKFIEFAARYLADYGFQQWISEQGGLDKMVGSSEDMPPIAVPEDPPL